MASRRSLAAAGLASLVLFGGACQARKDPPPGAPGAQIYELQNCANCHGKNGEGSALGPPLARLASSWKVDELTAYLLEPDAVLASDERLRAVAGAYTSQMAPYANLTEEQRRVLAGWLLERHP